jgi:hypothetical protein
VRGGDLKTVPPIVYDVLRSPGQPLDAATRAFREPQFGHYFGHVRVHSDAKAAESAKVVNALAYTVGEHVVLAEGKLPEGSEGVHHLLAHELAHVRQEGNQRYTGGNVSLGSQESIEEHEAEAQAVAIGAQADRRGDSHARDLSSVTTGILRRVSAAPSSSASTRGSSGNRSDGPGPSPGESCKIDVRATHIGGFLAGAPVWHLFLIYTNGSGREYYFRGGPGGSCPGVAAGGYGTIISTTGAYVAGTVDWDPRAPSTTVATGNTACGKDGCFVSELSRIDGLCTLYAPTGPNSNTVAKTLLSKCGLPIVKPVAIAPGWGNPDL